MAETFRWYMYITPPPLQFVSDVTRVVARSTLRNPVSTRQRPLTGIYRQDVKQIWSNFFSIFYECLLIAYTITKQGFLDVSDFASLCMTKHQLSLAKIISLRSSTGNDFIPGGKNNCFLGVTLS